MNWNIKIKTKLGNDDWSLDLTASEQSLLMTLRAFYPTIEAKVREVIRAGTSGVPAGLLDESLALVRCLVMNKLEPLNGKHIKIGRVL